MEKQPAPAARSLEGMALILIAVFTLLVFLSASAGLHLRQGLNPLSGLINAILPALLVIFLSAAFHRFLRGQTIRSEQILFPLVCLLFSVGLVLIWRLRGPDGAWQQILRGFLPGLAAAAFLVAQPLWIERIRRWAIPISLVGLALPVLTGLFGSVDETGARLALQLGPLPPIQTTEPLKLILIIFLAWYIERQGRAAEGRARILFGRLRLPGLGYFIPGALFTGLATLALVLMSDYGAVIILGIIAIAMLYAGFDTRTFLTIMSLSLILALAMGLVLSITWEVPTVIQYRFLAFQDPWSSEMVVIDGRSTGVTIAQGPGYQIQQSIYAIIAGGISGSGLGLGSPDYVPLAHSDFILAAVVEEMGLMVGAAVLILFAVMILRIFRMIFHLPTGQVFERLLVVGIGTHLFTQVVVMASGTLNLLPVTGVTIPFLSMGGMALLTNLFEIGLILALVRRQERAAQDV